MYSIIIYCVVLINLMYFIKPTIEFNISPKPNLIFKEPELKSTSLPKIRSSYFGFSIVLRENSLMIGAPRAQSTLESQRKINETGAIYKCLIKTQQCVPYIFDPLGNIIAEYSEYTYDSEKKDHQWLGMTMDGGPKETDRFVVCAPRLIADLSNKDYLMHGICYWTDQTVTEKSMKIEKISPLRLKNDQVKLINNTRYFYYMFGEQGISVHITENNEEIIIGSPGVHTWKGSMIRYSAKEKEDVGGLSRRESDINQPQRQLINHLLKENTIEYVSEVLNPNTWDQSDDSYFGYSVTSGFFELQSNRKQILYLASAPQANKQQGEVYLFDIVKTPQGSNSIKKYYTFHGKQFGEYFGYSLLTEDLNNDGMVDVIVTAPLHSVENSYEKGAIYVFMNKGKADFEDAKIITTKTDTPDRFGTTISKLGDINHDGYNDIAVGAPFEGNGAVYIFSGSSKGLKDKPSQILQYPKVNDIESNDRSLRAMFGHGLSKGVDIDGNTFNDLAIGSPNSEIVYLYKSYPVITVIGTVKAQSREIKIEQNKIQLNVCYYFESTTPTTPVNEEHEIIIELKIDTIYKRCIFDNTKTSEMTINTKVKKTQECKLINAFVKFNIATIFKPIQIEMNYKLKNQIPIGDNTTEIIDFCETCAVIDSINSTRSTEAISFSTGCVNECVADLEVKSFGLSSSFVIGSSELISVNYEIYNKGENAYLPQINITSSNHMKFAKIPSNCEANDDFVMICNLRVLPMATNDKEFITITFDATDIEGDGIEIQAEVSSTGKESNPDDNMVLDYIELIESSDIEIQAYPFPSTISLEDNSGIVGVTNTYEIRNYGPSKIKEINATVLIPISYLELNSKIPIKIIDLNSINVNVFYHEKTYRTDIYQNDVIVLQNSIEKSSTLISMVENLQNYEKNEEIKNINGKIDEFDSSTIHRKKRNTQNSNKSNIQNEKLLNVIESLPVNKTILLHCDNLNKNLICIKAITNIYDFKSNHNSVLNVTIKYNLNLTEINKILNEPMEFFVIANDLQITKANSKKSDIMNIRKTIAHNIISKHRIYSTPIWIYIVSVLGGVLLLTAIIYGFHKYGFFRRKKKEELQKLIRQSKIQQNDDKDDEQPLQK